MRRLTNLAAVGAAALCLIAGDARADQMLLALSWSPAFCETHRTTSECATQTPDRWDAGNFILHGLWPQPQGNDYCNVAAADISNDKGGHWELLPPVVVDEETRKDMDVLMPGSQSHLERHEWTKHGTCAKMGQDAYYDLAFSFVRQLAGMTTGRFISAHVGKMVRAQEVCQALEADFGPGIRASAQLRTSSTGAGQTRKTVLTELWIDLKTDASGVLALDSAHLARASKPLTCSGTFYIDPAGFGN